VFRYPDDTRERRYAGLRGTHLGTLGLDGRLRVEGTFTNRPWPRFWVVWSPEGSELPEMPRGQPGVVPPSPAQMEHPVWPPDRGDAGDDEPLPKLGERRHVDELPQSLAEEQPVYPREALAKHIQGTVTVWVLVDRRGVVRDTRVAHSIPALDAAAVQAVKNWRFRPALRNGEPVACWLLVPVKFTIH
jgi:protein TonB